AVEEERVGDLAPWHETSTAVVVKRPSDMLCEAASRLGVLVVAELDDPDLAEIRRLGRWPAVGLISLPGGCQFNAKTVAHNMLLAERLGDAQPAAWAHVVICEAPPGGVWKPPQSVLPVIAARRQGVAAVA